jgi:hypothetical protein
VERFKFALKVAGAFGLVPPGGILAVETVNSRSLTGIADHAGLVVRVAVAVVYSLVLVALTVLALLWRKHRRVETWRPARPVKPPVPALPKARLRLQLEPPELPGRMAMIEADARRRHKAGRYVVAGQIVKDDDGS